MPEFIEDNLRVIIFVVIIGAALLQKILEVAKARTKDSGPSMKEIFGPDSEPTRPRTPRPPYTPPPLGRTVTPPPIHPSSVPPPLRQVPVVSSAQDTEAEVIRQREMEERLRKIREAKGAAQPESVPAPVAITQQRAATATRGLLHRRLRHPKEIRRAFVLKEILDRPVGLR